MDVQIKVAGELLVDDVAAEILNHLTSYNLVEEFVSRYSDRFSPWEIHQALNDIHCATAEILKARNAVARPLRRYRPATCIFQGEGTMLVLSRKRNEKLVINDDIVITVVDIRGDKVRLGIEAPAEVPVHREEVYKAIQAAKDQPPDVELAEATS